MRTLDLALTPGPYLLGERFRAADVYLASQIGWALMTKALAPRESFARHLAHRGEADLQAPHGPVQRSLDSSRDVRELRRRCRSAIAMAGVGH